MSKLALAPTMKSGGDAEAARQLVHLYDEAQNGLRRVIALGLYCFDLKINQLKHGQFGPWIAAHCGEKVSYRTIRSYMQLTEGVLEKCQIKMAKALPICGGGEILLLPEGKVPEAGKELREKICAVVAGKSANQLFLEFKQSEDDDEGNVKVKRGALKNSKGLSKEAREKAAARAEQERINELEEEIIERSDWLEEITDAKNLGTQTDNVLKKFIKTGEAAISFAKRTLLSRHSPAKADESRKGESK